MNEDWTELEAESKRILLERYAPSGFLLDSAQNIILFFGDTSSYVKPLPGRSSFHFVKLIHSKLLPYIEAAMRTATHEQAARLENVALDDRGDKFIVEAILISTSTAHKAGFLILLHRELARLNPPRQAQDEWSRLRQEVEIMRASVTSLAEEKHVIETELEKVRAERQDAQSDLERIVGQILMDREKAEKSLALDLHDVFGQKLASLGLKLDALTIPAGRESEGVAEQIKDVKTQIEDFAEYVHQISRRLHPAFVEELGLKTALMDECQSWSEEHNVPLDCVIENLPDSLPEQVVLTLYRVTQEALNNIAKHANASSVRVLVQGNGGTIRLSVEDFGRGFDARTIRRGLGLISMEERVRAVNGRFKVDSRLGRGTTVEVAIPLK